MPENSAWTRTSPARVSGTATSASSTHTARRAEPSPPAPVRSIRPHTTKVTPSVSLARSRSSHSAPPSGFELRAFEFASGMIYLALVRGERSATAARSRPGPLGCVTGDALGSLRCDCGTQLREATREIAAEGRGVLVYATDHEGRGIGLVNKLRAYMLQENGADTIDANIHLGFPPDARRYDAAARCLRSSSVSALSGCSRTTRARWRRSCRPESTSSGPSRFGRRRTSETSSISTQRSASSGTSRPPGPRRRSDRDVNVAPLLGRAAAPSWRPYVVLKYAQTVDGRIALGVARQSGSPARRSGGSRTAFARRATPCSSASARPSSTIPS